MSDQTEATAPTGRGFASDNASGIHPEVLAAIAAANVGHQSGYGADAWTARLQRTVQRHFGATATGWPVFNGTGGNVLALQAVTDRWAGVVCAESAHVNTDEGGAPERVGGLKLLTISTPDGKLTPDLVEAQAYSTDDEHHPPPQVLSITQATELGTVYTPAEVAALCAYAHDRAITVHVDGARLANAAASLGVGLGEITFDAGVDVVTFGGTKNGIMLGEMVITRDPSLERTMRFTRKAVMQLGSKMRFVSAQLDALLDGDLWLRNASHANAMARRLADGVRDLPGVRVLHPVEANGVFAALPHDAIPRVLAEVPFYVWDVPAGVVRWMCSYDTTEGDVDALVGAVRAAVT